MVSFLYHLNYIFDTIPISMLLVSVIEIAT